MPRFAVEHSGQLKIRQTARTVYATALQQALPKDQ
jgi:hypothetical protein